MTIIFTDNFYKENDSLLYNLEIYKSFHKKVKIFENQTEMLNFFLELQKIYLFYIYLISKIHVYCKNQINRKKLLEFLKFVKDLNIVTDIFESKTNNKIFNEKMIIQKFKNMFEYKTKYNTTVTSNKFNTIISKIETNHNNFYKNNSKYINPFIKDNLNNLDLKENRTIYKESIKLIKSSNKQNKNIIFFCLFINLKNITQLLNEFNEFINNIII